MKFFAALFLTALLSFITGLFLPWWSIAIAALIVAVLIHQQAGRAFASAMLGVIILWGGLAWWISLKNQGLLAGKIAHILPFSGNTLLLILTTALIGGLVAGFGAMTGSFLRSKPR
jgi:hypothetical protein